MIMGSNVQFYKGSHVHVRRGSQSHAGTVTGFDAKAKQWRVSLDGKETLVETAAIKLRFSLLPCRVGFYAKVGFEASQGSCGRGLVAMTDIAKGRPVVEEAPMYIVCSHASPLDHHLERWRAYKTLEAKAAKDKRNGVWQKALAGFDDLVAVKPTVATKDAGRREAALEIARRESVEVERVQDVLDRFASNEFGVDNTRYGCSASALHCFTSRINHACAPTVTACSKESFCQRNGLPFDAERDNGVVTFVALRDVKKGERITASYSDSVLVQWMCGSDGGSVADSALASVQHRREHLRARFGFTCGCERCVGEAQQQQKTQKDHGVGARESEQERRTKKRAEIQAKLAAIKLAQAEEHDTSEPLAATDIVQAEEHNTSEPPATTDIVLNGRPAAASPSHHPAVPANAPVPSEDKAHDRIVPRPSKGEAHIGTSAVSVSAAHLSVARHVLLTAGCVAVLAVFVAKLRAMRR